MNVTGLICARGGSKGVPNKNLRIFAGKPLIYWTVKQALETIEIREVYVSTDSEEIAEVARAAGAKIPFLRPSDLSTDKSPEIDTWKHAVSFLEEKLQVHSDTIAVLPCTSPLRLPIDVSNCIQLRQTKNADIAVSMCESERNPYFNMVQKSADGTIQVLMQQSKQVSRRQDAPVVYDLTTVAYAFDPRYIRTATSIFEGKVVGIEVPRERAMDIDTMLDFEIAEYLFLKSRSK
jgi:N-acylneuraminate cytidylyltransferase